MSVSSLATQGPTSPGLVPLNVVSIAASFALYSAGSLLAHLFVALSLLEASPRGYLLGPAPITFSSARYLEVCPLHNVYFVQYIFPRNRTSSDLSYLKNTILLNIYLSQLVRVRGKYTFLSFSDFQTLDP